ncbi:hypothetical protein WIS52_01050 [Pseudonocardia nematodicida]|uniref:protein-tyrosine-phosphatase n=1 Tax=Pseudonocardia nematodicida TaxID=1206997 RepID=A0ABV1K3K2_9PSEU
MTSLADRPVAHTPVRPSRLRFEAHAVHLPPEPARRGPDDRFRMLIVCTGNICRSPAAELLMRHLLIGRLGGREAARIEISSAGVVAVVGAGMHPLTRAQLAPWGLAPRSNGFRARQLDDDVVRGVDLILGANVRHRSAVLERFPHVVDRTFALREFARLAGAVDPGVLPSGLVERSRALVGAARSRRGTIPQADDTVPDPMGLPEAAHRDAVSLVFEAACGIADAVAPRTRESRRHA